MRSARRKESVLVLLVILLSGCGSNQPTPPASTNYSSSGVWLGERYGSASTDRVCGWMTEGRDTASGVLVRGLSCAAVAGVIRASLRTGAVQAPRGWRLRLRAEHPGLGGPPGVSSIHQQVFLSRSGSGVQFVTFLLGEGRRVAPQPLMGVANGDEVQFGCRTVSSICAPPSDRRRIR